MLITLVLTNRGERHIAQANELMEKLCLKPRFKTLRDRREDLAIIRSTPSLLKCFPTEDALEKHPYFWLGTHSVHLDDLSPQAAMELLQVVYIHLRDNIVAIPRNCFETIAYRAQEKGDEELLVTNTVPNIPMSPNQAWGLLTDPMLDWEHPSMAEEKAEMEKPIRNCKPCPKCGAPTAWVIDSTFTRSWHECDRCDWTSE